MPYDSDPEDALHTPPSLNIERLDMSRSPRDYKWGNTHTDVDLDLDPYETSACTPRTVGNVCIAIGVLLVLLSVIVSSYVPKMISNKIQAGVAICHAADLEPQSYIDAYGDCADCTPRYFTLYMFNVTNSEAYLRGDSKLQVHEVGPYVYRKREIRVDSALDGDLLRYKSYSYHKFVPQMSCAQCSDSDTVTSWDLGYLRVMSAAGGEQGFLRSLIPALGAGSVATNASAIDQVIKTSGTQILRFVNALNSNDPKAWQVVGNSVSSFLMLGPSAIAALDLSSFAYNGVFATRSIADWALGYPSMLAGLAVGTAHASCESSKTLEKCQTCTGDQCITMKPACARCKAAKYVVEITNSTTCGQIEERMTAVVGAEEGKKFASSTCGSLCAMAGLCVAPMPGFVEASGLDHSKTPPSSNSLSWTIQDTGCSNHSHIGQYKLYEGANATAIWAKLDSRRNPTLAEIGMFGSYANCDKPLPNVTCTEVVGNDATSLLPGGATMSGFPEKVLQPSTDMYLSQASQNVTLLNSGKVMTDIAGVKLTRFQPPNDLLSYHAWNEGKGIGYPVDGVLSLAFSYGFLAYLSYPMFLYGDDSLTEHVEITMIDGAKATKSTLFDGDELKSQYFDRFMTFVDVDPGTGKTMRARQRLQANFALAKSQYAPNAPLSDVLWPNATAEVIVPSYYGEQSATVTSKSVKSFKSINNLLRALMPILIIGSLFGLAIIVWGCRYRRRHQSSRKLPSNLI